jgi:hypothetical protein
MRIWCIKIGNVLVSHSVPLRTLNTLFEKARANSYLDFSTAEYRLNSMIMDVAPHRLFKPPQITDTPLETCRQSFKPNFSNKGMDAVNLSKILRHKEL